MSSQKNKSKPLKPVEKTTLIIQLDTDLKESFQLLCKSQDMNCSQVLRRFMKTSVDSYKKNNLNFFRKP